MADSRHHGRLSKAISFSLNQPPLFLHLFCKKCCAIIRARRAMTTDREKALELAIGQIEKRFGIKNYNVKFKLNC